MDGRGRPHLWGRERRYMLTELLWERGPMTVAELGAALADEGWHVGGRPSKTISDALRWEIAHGRVVRLRRGLYGPGRMPKQTRHWIRCRNRRSREEAHARLAAVREATPGRGCSESPTSGRHTGPVAPPEVDRDSGAVDHAHRGPPDAGRRRRSPESTTAADTDIVVVGAGWSEADDAAEDERIRARFLFGPHRTSAG